MSRRPGYGAHRCVGPGLGASAGTSGAAKNRFHQLAGNPAAESTYLKEVDGFRTEVQKLQASLDSAVQAFDQQSIALSPAARQTKQRDLQGMQQRLETRTNELQDRARQREQDLLSPIQARVNSVIQGIRAELNYSLILDADAPGGIIVAADPALNITVNSAGTRPIPASEIAALTGGRLVGPGETTVAGIAPLERAGPGDLSFLASSRYLPYFQRTSASVALIKAEFVDALGGCATRIVVPDPHAALLVVIPVLYPQAVWEPGVHPTAVVGRGAVWQDPVEIGAHAVLGAGVQLGKGVRIGAGCVLGDGVAIGDETLLYPGVTCYAGTALGKRVIVHAGAVLGSDGFGYVPGKGGEAHRKIPHVGRCVIGDDVQCAFHGWRFGADGRCRAAPGPASRACCRRSSSAGRPSPAGSRA